jgi:hypothetical protein
MRIDIGSNNACILCRRPMGCAASPWSRGFPQARALRSFPSTRSVRRDQARGFTLYSLPTKSWSENKAETGVASTKHVAYIALGSNLGDRIGMIERACREMTSRGIRVKRTSSLWETEPMYVLDQDHFVNGACEVGQNANPSLMTLGEFSC